MPTISDVARRAGVSTVTVSRVINNAPNVNPGTREKVEHAIHELGYLPNVVARSLRSKRTHSLALIVPDITNIFWTTVARGVEDAAQDRGYSVLLCNTDESPVKQSRYLKVVASQRVDGVIIAPYDGDAANLAELRVREIPTVVVDRRINGWDVDTVLSDSVASGRALVRYLIAHGHRQIAAVSGPAGTSTADDRLQGYFLALAEAGIAADPDLVKRGEFRAAAGEKLVCELFGEGRRPTAIFAANNAIALGVIDGLSSLDLRVPDDVSLVCVDDLPLADRCFPFLTVAVQPAYEMGTHAAQLLLDRLATGGSPAPHHLLLPCRLIVRGAQPQTLVIEPLGPREPDGLPAL